MELLEILKRESESSPKVYLYEDKGHWFAYENSALMISTLLKGIVTIKQLINNAYDVMLRIVEIKDLSLLANCSVTSCSDTELVIAYQEDTDNAEKS